MSVFHFGVGKGVVSATRAKRIERIAARHGAVFYAATIPGDGAKYWFSCRSYGHPFDEATARAVLDDVERELGGVVLPARRRVA